jgi:hypothetical protein
LIFKKHAQRESDDPKLPDKESSCGRKFAQAKDPDIVDEEFCSPFNHHALVSPGVFTLAVTA